jgi:hypothetical protein
MKVLAVLHCNYYMTPAVMTGLPVIAAGAVAGLFSRGKVKVLQSRLNACSRGWLFLSRHKLQQ